MKHLIFFPNLFAVVIVMSVVVLGPVTVPYITPYPYVRMVVTCQGPVTGDVMVVDSQGHTHSQTCTQVTPITIAYPALFPAANAPWQVIVSARSLDRAGYPRPCWFTVTGVPVHLHCAANSEGQRTVSLDMSPLDSPGSF